MIIPENLTDFLWWVKERTEALWSGEDWQKHEFYGAKWQPLTEQQIDEIEERYAVKFNHEHRAFLRILHAIDKKEVIEYEDENDEVISEESTFFYNWLEDEGEILETLKMPYQWMFDDLDCVNNVWLKSWGIKPKSETRRKEIFDEWFSHVPKLLPLKGTRFIVSDENLQWRPILSRI
jgi:hypothetical protein